MARETSEACIRLLRALADETRWKIIRELIANPATVHDLSVRLKATQYNVSKHLRILRESGIVTAKRTGKYVVCDIAKEFRRRLSGNKNQLDLGCCTFRFH